MTPLLKELMATTTLQTAEVHLPDSPFSVYTLETCPTLPKEEESLLKECAVRKQLPNGTKIVWTPQGNVEQYGHNGILKVWYAKPTLKEAVLSSGKMSFPTMFQFKSDGSMYARLRGIPYCWAARQGQPVLGPYELAYGYSEAAGWLFADTPCDSCECDAEDYGDRYD